MAEKYRNRTHFLLLYPDDESHMKALEIIKHNYDYALILHDKDVYLDGDKKGELKKAHYHCIIYNINSTWNTAICKKLGIDLNYCREVQKFDRALAYLIHFFEPEKFQYDIEEVEGPLKTRLKDYIKKQNRTEGECVTDLFDEINNIDDVITVSWFARYCATNGYWSEFRRSSSIFMRIIDEHNELVYRKRRNEERYNK